MRELQRRISHALEGAVTDYLVFWPAVSYPPPMRRTPRVMNRLVPWKLTVVLGALVSLAGWALSPDASHTSMEPERDRPERVTIARLLARLTPAERQPRGLFFPQT